MNTLVDWQLIKTAPKDGTRILLWFTDGREFVTAFWDTKEGDWWSDPYDPHRLHNPSWEGDATAPTNWAPGPEGPKPGLQILSEVPGKIDS